MQVTCGSSHGLEALLDLCETIKLGVLRIQQDCQKKLEGVAMLVADCLYINIYNFFKLINRTGLAGAVQ